MGAGKSKPSLKPEELADLRQQTFFSDQEIQEWYKGFIRDCPSGKIDAAEFKIMYQNIFPEGDPSAFSDHVFRYEMIRGSRGHGRVATCSQVCRLV